MAIFTLTGGADDFPGAGQDTSGNDTITGLAGSDTIRGGTGNDLIFGGSEADSLLGDDGHDVIDLGAQTGNDTADGGIGLDSLVIHYAGMTNLTTGLPVNVVAHFATGPWSTSVDGSTGATLANFERMVIDTGNGADDIRGGAGRDVIAAAGGNDTLRGGGGNDRISDSWGVYDANGGIGIDTLVVSGANAKDLGAGLQFIVSAQAALGGTITAGTSASGSFFNFEKYDVTGTANRDVVQLGQGDDRALGGKGNDEVYGGGGNDVLDGGLGHDLVSGDAGNDVLHSGERTSTTAAQANDLLFGGDGDDLLYADTSVNGGTMRSYAGALFNGGAGNDTLQIQDLVATIDLTGATITDVESFVYGTTFQGNALMTAAQVGSIANFNTYKISIMTAGDIVISGRVEVTEIRLWGGGQSIDLSGSTRAVLDLGPRVVGGDGDDFMRGSLRRDDFIGGGGADSMEGGQGEDVLTGGAGTDEFYGGEHNDFLTGDSGADLLSGGTGKDVFDFNAITDSGLILADMDVIADFIVNPDASTAFVDRLDLSTIDARASTAGVNEMFVFVGLGGFTAEGQVRAVQSGADTIVEFNTIGVGGAEMAIVLANFLAATLTGDDIFE